MFMVLGVVVALLVVSGCTKKKVVSTPPETKPRSVEIFTDEKPAPQPSVTSVEEEVVARETTIVQETEEGDTMAVVEEQTVLVAEESETVESGASSYVEEGLAAWYGGPEFNGKTTASGEIYDQEKLTAAHRILPFGTQVEVTNLANGKSVVVIVNDRGPYKDPDKRIIDVSLAAARALSMENTGLVPVRIKKVGPEEEAAKTLVVEEEAVVLEERSETGDEVVAVEKETVVVQEAAKAEAAPDFYVQVGAFSNAENAQNVLADLLSRGYAGARVVTVTVNSKELRRVQAGAFATRAQAESELSRLQADYPQSIVVTD